MKKFIIILTVIALTLLMFSCSSSAFDSIVSQLEESYWQSSSIYTDEQIDQIEGSFGQFGLNITGEVQSIAHFVKPSYPESTWVYVYEFENEADAKTFKESYADNWGNAIISGTIVVYGNNSEIISNIKLQH